MHSFEKCCHRDQKDRAEEDGAGEELRDECLWSQELRRTWSTNFNLVSSFAGLERNKRATLIFSLKSSSSRKTFGGAFRKAMKYSTGVGMRNNEIIINTGGLKY
jgi:hypothetical protein